MVWQNVRHSARWRKDMSGAHSQPPTTDFLLRSVRRIRTQAVMVWLMTLVGGACGSLLLVLLTGVLLDGMFVLPAALRLVMLVLVVAAPAAVAVAAWRARPRRSLEAAALMVERRFPGLDNALINSVQFSGSATPVDAAPFVDEIAAEARQRLDAVRPGAAVAKHWMALSLIAAVAGGAMLVQQAANHHTQLAQGLNRVLVPFGDNTYTRIDEVRPGHCDVLIGSDVEVVAALSGRIPTRGRLDVVSPGEPARFIDLIAPSANTPDRLLGVIERVGADLTYAVSAGDDRSQTYHIHVHERPTVERITHTIRPPAYVAEQPAARLGGSIRALPGSTVNVAITASKPIRRGRVIVNDMQPVALRRLGSRDARTTTGYASFPVKAAGRYRIELTDTLGFDAEPITYDIHLLTDAPPTAMFVQPKSDVSVDIDAQVVVEVQATDDFAVERIELRQVGADQPIETWSVQQGVERQVKRSIRIAVAEWGLSAQTPLVLQAAAFDQRPGADPGLSPPLTLSLQTDAEATNPVAETKVPLDDLITLQRQNIDATEKLPPANDGDALGAVIARQERIQALADQRARTAAVENPQRADQLRALAESLMVVAVEQLRQVKLPAALVTQRAILKALTAAAAQQNEASQSRAARQLAEMLAELVVKQKKLIEDTASGALSAASLGARQRLLARHVVAFTRSVTAEIKTGAGGDADLVETYTQALDAIEKGRVRAQMLLAAARLAEHDEAAAPQAAALEALQAALAIFRKSALDDAREQLEQLREGLEDAKDRVDKLVELQRSVTEVAEQLEKTRDRRDGRADEVDIARELEDVRQDIADAIEELVKDMHLFPTSDISNDLLTEMAEIYEDITQKEGSENQAVQEIAVDRDEGLLAALKKMQEKMGERLGDLEMWMPDTPDTIRWKQESFDRNEMGDIPLGDLPDALEDIVGDLTEQAQQLTEEAQDSASNVGLPDMTMGWDIMDGPMPSWAAKGKSGNQRPNEMEQIGRSGAGRQGMSSGEIVGDTIKALEGSDVKTRRTQDPFQAGELAEEDPGFMDVKATGGGKLAGITNTEGMSGDAPSRDVLKYRQLQRNAELLRRHTQTVYTKARLMRLPTGGLDRALLEMDAAQRRLDAGDIEGFIRGQNQIVRVLKQTQRRLGGEIVLEDAAPAGRNVNRPGAIRESIPAQYEQAVADYMRRIAEGQ